MQFKRLNMKLFVRGWNVILASKMWELGFHGWIRPESVARPREETLVINYETCPPLPSYIKPWRQYNFLFRYIRMMIRCQKGSDNNYRTKPTSAWTLVANGMNFELLFTTEVIPPSHWVSNRSCKRGLGKNRQSIPSTTQRRYYNVSNLPPETFFRGQEDLCWPTRPASTTNLPKRSSE